MGNRKWDISTVQAAWQALLDALETGDPEKIAAVITEKMFSKLFSEPEYRKPERLRQLAANWRQWQIRWGDPIPDAHGVESVVAFIGPESKQHLLTFQKTADGWKLDQWTPGL